MLRHLKLSSALIISLFSAATLVQANEQLLDGVRPFLCDGEAMVFIEKEDGWTIPTYSTGDVKRTGSGWRIEDITDGSVMYLREDSDNSWVVDRVSEEGHIKFDCIDFTETVSQVVTIIKPRLSDTIVETQQALSQATKDLGVVEQNRLQLLADQRVEMNRARAKHNAAIARAEAEHNAAMSRSEADHNAKMSRVKEVQREEMNRATEKYDAARCCQTKSNRYQSTTITQIYEAQI